MNVAIHSPHAHPHMSVTCIHTAHLINLAGIHLLTSPLLSLNRLRIRLPFRQESHDMHGVLHILMIVEFFLHELVADDALFGL